MACSSSLAYGTVVSPRTMTAAGATQPELCFPVASAGDDGLHSSCDATECSRIGADGLRGSVELCEVSAVRAANYGAVLVLAERASGGESMVSVMRGLEVFAGPGLPAPTYTTREVLNRAGRSITRLPTAILWEPNRRAASLW